MTTNTRLCPQCGSAKVTIDKGNVIAAGPDVSKATCSACGWVGEVKDLMRAIMPAKGIDASMHVAEEVSKAYLSTLAVEAGKAIGLSIIKSGLIGIKDSDGLARLIKAACLGAHKATLDEIEVMQRELANGTRN